jgi:hypothetical protein
MVYMAYYTLSECAQIVNGMPHGKRQYIVIKARDSHVDSDQMRKYTTRSTNFSSSTLLRFVCFPDVAVVHSQQVSTPVWSDSEHTVRKAIGGSVCAWKT